MSPVGGTECITYIIVCQVSQFFTERFAVLGLFFAAETGILKQHHIAFAHLCHSFGGCLAGYIVICYKVYFLAQLLRQPLGNRSQGLSLVGAILYLA